MEGEKQSTIFICDDHPLFRCGLRLSLNQLANLEVVGEAENGFDAVERIIACKPDMALVDVDMPGLSGISAIKVLRKALPKLRILVLSALEDDHYVRDAMAAGADGYLLKCVDIDALVQIIGSLCKGIPAVSPYLLNLTIDDLSGAKNSGSSLTTREKDVLRCMLEGKENKEIADELFISCETVKSHIKHIFSKLEVTNRVQAVQVAAEKKILNS
jgi:DNA-binding NarL/FixJ family response regulator